MSRICLVKAFHRVGFVLESVNRLVRRDAASGMDERAREASSI